MQSTEAILDLIDWVERERKHSRSWRVVNRLEGGVVIEIRDGLLRGDRVVSKAELQSAKFDILSANVHQLINALSEGFKEYHS